jgi:hypothetical protein
MASCICGNSYMPKYSLSNRGYNNLDLCPACIAASNPQSYVNSVEWVQGTTTENTEYNPQQNDN